MRVLLAGATGMLGGMIARRLLEQGEGLRILVRPGSDHRVLVDAGAEPVLGDLRDRRSLEVACTGVEAVITTANAGPRSGEEMIEAVDRQGNRNLMNAAKAAGVGRFIYVSAMPARLDYPDSFIRAKAETEK
ncbi:MAG: NAD(P)H-binding protein [Anaerolineae bacterium]